MDDGRSILGATVKYECWLAARYLFSQRHDRFIRLVGVIAVCGVAIGVMALIVVLAVMTGFDRELEAKIIGTNAHVVIERSGGMFDSEDALARVRQVDGVVAASPFLTSHAMVERYGQTQSVVLRGIQPDTERAVTELAKYVKQGRFELQEGDVLIGDELARQMGVAVDGEVVLLTPLTRQSRGVRVAGLFHSGMYDFDASLVLAPLPDVQAMVAVPGVVGGIGVRLDRLEHARRVKQDIIDSLGGGYTVRTWMELNANLFAALKLEKIAMFVILALIVLVASCNIASTLLMTVLEKIKDIGILQAVGSTSHGIRMIFTCQGMLIGAFGTLLGVAGGVGLCEFLKRSQLIRLPQDVYYIDRLPVAMQWGDIGAVVAAACVITLLAAVYPAWVASRLQPVDALRYE